MNNKSNPVGWMVEISGADKFFYSEKSAINARKRYERDMDAEPGEPPCPLYRGPTAQPQPAAHLTIPGALEWDGDNGTHGVVGTHGADGEANAHSEDCKVARIRFVFRDGEPAAEIVWFSAGEVNPLEVRELDLYVRPGSADVAQLRAQLANTEQSRRSFFDLSQDLENRLAERDALLLEANDLLSGIWDKSYDYEAGDALVALSLIDKIAALSASAEPAKCESCGGWGHIETEDSAHDCPECGPSVIERAIEAGVMNAPKSYAADDIPDFTPGNGNKAKRRIAAMAAKGGEQ